MLEAIAAEWNNQWTLEQIEWVEERYDSWSRTTRKCKQQLTSIPNLDSFSNSELYTANSWDILVNHNHKHNSFKTKDFKLYFSILLLPKCCTPYLIQGNPHLYINPIINRFTNINLWLCTKSSMHMNPSMHMRTITSPITINRPLLGPPIQHLSLPRFDRRKHSQYNRLLFRSPIQC